MKKRSHTRMPARCCGLLIAALSLAALLGCGADRGLEVAAQDAVSVMILSLPQSESRARSYTSQEKILEVIDYLNGLSLEKRFSEDPDDYVGETLVITVAYNDGGKRTFYHFGNMFIKEGDGPWMRMAYKEAEELDDLLRKTASD